MINLELTSENVVDIVTDIEHWFTLVHIPEIDKYFLSVVIPWIAHYDRYYLIDQNDLELYQNDKESFLEKFKAELGCRVADCFNDRFAGAKALRDYDGRPRFQDAFPPPKDVINPFQGFGYEDGIFYAHIVWWHEEIYVPPMKIIKSGETNYFPLREKCELQCDKLGTPICYKLKK